MTAPSDPLPLWEGVSPCYTGSMRQIAVTAQDGTVIKFAADTDEGWRQLRVDLGLKKGDAGQARMDLDAGWTEARVRSAALGQYVGLAVFDE